MSTSYERTSTTSSYNVTHSVPPHSLVIQRTSGSLYGAQSGGSSKSMTRTIQMSSGGGGDVSFSEGQYATVTASGLNAVKDAREQEKKDMQDLNDRFASYIDKVRTLEAQNRKLADDLDKLKTKWGKETAQIKAMYQAELDEARHALDEAEKEKARLEIKVASLEEQIEELRIKLTIAQQELVTYTEKMNRQTQQISDYEYEISLLRKQIESLETEREKDKKKIAELEELLAKAREDLDNETLAHIDAENRRQTLEEQIEFLKSIHDQEMKELAALAYRDNLPESRDFWKNEMAQAIREIEQMYADKLETMKTEMESSYNLKIQEFRTGATRQAMETTRSKEDCKDLRINVTDLRDKINDLDNKNAQLAREIDALRRAKEDREREMEADNTALRREAEGLRGELESILRELQAIMDSKMGLELEIAAYRKLLEGEETRTSLREVNTSESYSALHSGGGGGGGYGGGVGGGFADEGSSARGELAAKTTYQRAAKGAIAVSECPPDGKCVKIENTGRKEENIENWSIRRTVDGTDQEPYVLDGRFKAIKAGAKFTIWAKGSKPSRSGPADYEMDESSWGIGSLVVTKLFNPEGDERASLTQKTVYS